MKFTLTPPGTLEVEEVKGEDTGLTIKPVLVKNNHVLRVAYCQATGANGTESKAVLLFNANTGEFSLQPVKKEDVNFHFDKPVDEFQRLRAAARKGKAKKGNTDSSQSTKT